MGGGFYITIFFISDRLQGMVVGQMRRKLNLSVRNFFKKQCYGKYEPVLRGGLSPPFFFYFLTIDALA